MSLTPEVEIRLIREALLRAAPLSAAEQDAMSTVADLVLRPSQQPAINLQPIDDAAHQVLSAAELVIDRVDELRDALNPPPSPTLMQRFLGLFRRTP